MHYMCIITKPDVSQHQFPFALGINLIGTVHHDFGHAFILQQRLNRPVAGHFVNDLRDDPAAFGPRHWNRFFVHTGVCDLGYGFFQLSAFQVGHTQFADNPLVDLAFQRLKRVGAKRRRRLYSLAQLASQRRFIFFAAFQPFEQ